MKNNNDKRNLRKLHGQWKRGERSKSEIERTEFAEFNARGKFITRLWMSRLNVTSTVSDRKVATR